MTRVCLLLLAVLLACARANEDAAVRPAGIADDENIATVVTGELGNPLLVSCLEAEEPTLFVFWYRGHGKGKLLKNNAVYGTRRNALLIRSLAIDTLGAYTCQAYTSDDMKPPRIFIVRVKIPDGKSPPGSDWLVPRSSGAPSLGTQPPTSLETSTTTMTTTEDLGLWFTETSTGREFTETTEETTKASEVETSARSTINEGTTDVATSNLNPCSGFQFGCCADNETQATGPKEEGCPLPDPVRTPAGEENRVIGELDKPFQVCCPANGLPPSSVEWYRSDERNTPLYNDTVYEPRGNVLLIRSLNFDNLGLYTCGANNGGGQTASSKVVVKAFEPDGLLTKHEWLVPRGTVAPSLGTQCLTTPETTTTTTLRTTNTPTPLGDMADKCTLPAETGQCSNYRERWFYDTTYKRCRQFYYGGCGGNENNFGTEAECDNSCSEIKTTTTTTTTTTTASPVEPQPQPRPHETNQAPTAPDRSDVPAAPLALPQPEPELVASEGGLATLRCLFHGNPPPKITWWFGELTIEGNVGRYRLMSDGALEIVSLYRNDTGVYVCVADNGLGVATQEIHLAVSDPVRFPVGIAGDENTVVTGELGSPLEVRCLAYGYPPPSVFWYRGYEGSAIIVPYNDMVYLARGNILLIRRLAIETLGQYTCRAYNGEGKAASWVVFVRAYQPEGLVIENELLVPRNTLPPRPRTRPPTTAETTTTTTTSTTEKHRPLFTVPVYTHVSTPYSTLNSGADLHLTCDVDGFPEPDVHWTKDGATIQMDGRVTTTGSTIVSRLTVSRVTVADSGLYTCHASNQYSSHSESAQINVQHLVVPAKYTDNPLFADCGLIVRSKFCRHSYYSKFCCKSCVEAGQLDPQEAVLQADQP